MKKYQQLLILSLGILSFISFLIYKHEYDRLRNVLSVMEVFGSPPPIKVHEHLQVDDKIDKLHIAVADHPNEALENNEIKNSGEVFDPPSENKIKPVLDLPRDDAKLP